jgi:ABC-type Fe3+ transport system permease subunit
MARSDFPVLSLLVFRLAGAYRYGAAAAAGLVLLALSGSAMALAWKEATWTAS